MEVMKKNKISELAIILTIFIGFTQLLAQSGKYPRIYTTDEAKLDFLESVKNVEWKRQFVEEKKSKLEKYLKLCREEPNWLVSRLQMNWKTKHSKVFLNGIKFSHSDGEAPVPTVRYSGSRDPATDYVFPKFEELEPYLDDVRGMHLINKKTAEMEWVHPSQTGYGIEGVNSNIMLLVQDAAFLYWLTGETKYAEFAEIIFFTYIEGMFYRDAPIDLTNSAQQRISGLSSFEVIHDKIVVSLAVTYDFLHSYFEAKNINLSHTISVFQKWADQIINNGIPDNNWNLLQARYVIYTALVLDENEKYSNGKGREYYLERIINNSSERQIAIKEAVLQYDQETGIWPESPGYSVHTTKSFLQILTLLDNFTNKNELSNYPIIEKSVLTSFQYLFPSGYMVAFGDSKHGTIPPENFELLISNYRKYKQKAKELMLTSLLSGLIEKGDYERERKDLFELFFYVDSLQQTELENVEESVSKLEWSTFYAPNVSLFIQRMATGDDAMMVSTVGSFGNHSHVNGIAIELFANNYVLGPDMSKGGSYWSPSYREYYSQFPAHNTVVVDGQSTYNRMRGYNPFTLDNYFPETGESTTSFDNVTFSKVSFVEPQTMSDQQRLTAQIKTESGKGYILDIFRSRKKNPTSQKHEYFYHNLGQTLEILDSADNIIDLNPSDELGSSHGDITAYDYLTEKESVKSDDDVKALFTLKSKKVPDNHMKIWIKGSENQKIFSVKSPKSDALIKGSAPLEMLGEKIPTLILRRNEEAWNNPFALVFNPYIDGLKNPIKYVKFSDIPLNYETQKIEILHQDSITKDIIIANSSINDVTTENAFFQKGLLSIIRLSDTLMIPKFIFLAGVYKFEYDGWQILSKNKAVTLSIELIDGELHIQNDKPIVLNVPIKEGFLADNLKIYENGKLVSEEKGFVSRNNSEQVEFLLGKPYNNAVIEFNK